MALWQKDELLAKDLKNRIFSNKEPFNQVITSERKIAQRYSVSRNTVRKALNTLLNENILYLSNHKYVLNPFNSDPIYRDLSGIPQSTKLIFTISNHKLIEANKILATQLNISLGDKITLYEYFLSLPLEEFIPFEYNYLYIPGNFESKKTSETPLKQYCQHLYNSQIIETQNVKLASPSKKSQFYLQAPANKKVVKRTSTFDCDDTKFLLISEIIAKWATIFNPSQKIQKEVNAFVE
ncbi:GntR family transcriptional regulator [Lactobacillus crispatus]|uniref:GntR family transcriptional regulator n=1 Tax=Lactobacillus crispatus TaxID=47770 RepID=A0A7H9EBJ0_9LACO|nr:GntR family transcriptional regulator [Lactobacillus crispatus]MBD0968019.1 GntR family transcriptional regulator [Lactobacillus crispatus]QLL74980.1 GntR family transcriptional regulator [Lactobacillus crispatus]